MNADVFFYHSALADLDRSARAFAAAIEHAGACAARLPDGAGDLLAVQTFKNCNEVLTRAFARVPGMVQVLTGKTGG